jgi:competence ComEA-like helix-hairpin-helix protein
MLKRMLLILLACLCFAVPVWAAVDVNTADQATLESVKGLGPVKSQAIIDERNKNGPFKDAKDLAVRVKGLGTKSVANLQEQGLTIGGSARAVPTAPGQRGAPTTVPSQQQRPAQAPATPASPAAATASKKPSAALPGQTPTATTGAMTGASGTTATKKAGTTSRDGSDTGRRDAVASGTTAGGIAASADTDKTSKAKKKKSKTEAADQATPRP